jgi:hypothetical protein
MTYISAYKFKGEKGRMVYSCADTKLRNWKPGKRGLFCKVSRPSTERYLPRNQREQGTYFPGSKAVENSASQFISPFRYLKHLSVSLAESVSHDAYVRSKAWRS